MRAFLNLLSDIYIIVHQRIKWGKNIILFNKGYIQWDDLTLIQRSGWYNRYSIEDMCKFAEDLKS